MNSFIEFTNKYDIRKRVCEVKVPTLVVAGEKTWEYDKVQPVFAQGN